MDDQAGQVAAIRDVPLFGAFSGDELERLAGLCSEVSFRKGETLWSEGDPGDSFLVVLAGELEVLAGERVVARLGPGDFLGETALLLGEARTATVRASRRSQLLTLSADDFGESFAQNAKVLEHLSRVLSQRLTARNRDEVVHRSVTVIGVVGEAGLVGRSLVAGPLAALLARITGRPALLVDVSSPDAGGARSHDRYDLGDLAGEPVDRLRTMVESDRHPVPRLVTSLPVGGAGERFTGGLDAVTRALGAEFPVIVADISGSVALDSAVVAEVCDVIVEIVARPGATATVTHAAHTRIFEVVNLFNEQSTPIAINRCEPFVVPVDFALDDGDPVSQTLHVLENPWSPATPPLTRLARKILGVSVGIALGGGAAFGVAHVGVLAALEAAGVPLDLVVGTSMGSIVAMGYAGGLRPAAMEEIAGRIGNVRTVLSALDVTLTRPGFLRGDRLVSIFGPLLGSVQTFDQLLIPAQTVACDIESGERICLGEGRLDAAFRASSSVPMIWAPVRRDGRTLVDGSMVDPVPAEVVREMGADLCIAVNVVPQLQKGVTTALQRVYQRVNTFNPLSYTSGSRDMPNMFDLVMNSIQSLQYELGNFKAISADVRINVELAEFTWIDFHRALELIARGAEAATAALPDIDRMLTERLPQPS